MLAERSLRGKEATSCLGSAGYAPIASSSRKPRNCNTYASCAWLPCCNASLSIEMMVYKRGQRTRANARWFKGLQFRERLVICSPPPSRVASFGTVEARSSAPPPQARGHGRSQAGQRAVLRHRLCFEKAARHDRLAAFSLSAILLGRVLELRRLRSPRPLTPSKRGEGAGRRAKADARLFRQADRHPAIAPDGAHMLEVLAVIGGEHLPALFG